jgi:hypothetical protein
MTRRTAVVLAALLCVVPPARAQLDLGPEFQVNTYTTGRQAAPAVAIGGDGSFVVTWHSRYEFSYFGDYDQPDAPGDSASGVFLQRFDADGVPVGGEQHVNTFTPSQQVLPDVSASADGKFVVVWQSGCRTFGHPQPCSPGAYGPAVALQRFDAAGAPAGTEQVVNAITPDLRFSPAVASTPAGEFVVVWRSNSPGYSAQEIAARRFSADGTPAGDEFRVSARGTLHHPPDVAVDAAGNFVVVWRSSAVSTYEQTIQARMFDASGVPLGEIEVAREGEEVQYVRSPAVAATAGGEFVVVWEAYYPFRIGREIRGRRFAADGTPLGPPVRVNTKADREQTGPAVAADAAGNFVVTWATYDYDSRRYPIAAQAFAHDGVPLGREFQVASMALYQREAAIAGNGAGEFVVAWSSYYDYRGGRDVFARQLSLPPCSEAAECDDADLCTIDTCEGGVCLDRLQPGCCHVPDDCDDLDPCTDDVCTANACSNPPIPGCVSCQFGSGNVCTAPNPCTIAFCDGSLGRCQSAAIPGCCLTAADCDDGLTCTEDACDAEHACTNTLIPDCVACSEDAECSTGCLIAPETCEAGRCVSPTGCPIVTIDEHEPLGESGKLLVRVQVPVDVPGKGKIKIVVTGTVGQLDPSDEPSRRCNQGKVAGRSRAVVEPGGDRAALLALTKAGARCLAADPDAALPIAITVQVRRRKQPLSKVTEPRIWRR